MLYWLVALSRRPTVSRAHDPGEQGGTPGAVAIPRGPALWPRPSLGVAVLASVDAPRTRRSFARLEKVLDVPNLIDIQKKSFSWLVDTES